MVGGGNDDGVDIGAVQHFAVIEIAIHLEGFFAAVDALLVNVANGDDLGVGFFFAGFIEFTGDIKPAATGTDDGDVNAVIGADDASGAGGGVWLRRLWRWRERRRRAGNCVDLQSRKT